MTTKVAPFRTAAQIRQEFIDFFRQRHGHEFVRSSPVVPLNDPSLMFINAGMNQFKDVFLGRGDRPYRRAANTQKCIRAGGKHNDLEDVGRDHYHHTFFEMLGNWSFGDYFKAEAIEWAWDLLVNVWGIDRDRLYVTVFAGTADEGLEPDTEAAALWRRHVEPGRISRWGKKDNFWEMGETGPCGPCSEIHYDSRSSQERARQDGHELVNRNHPDVIEVWNLVFIQFDRGAGGALTPLPARHVDTGMGLERLVRVLQGKQSNYDTDIWTPIFRAIEAHTLAHPYRGRLNDPVDVAYRVIADHVRCLTVAITDGGRPSSEKAGYVLRRILRRAVRHAHQTLGVDGPLLCDIVPAVAESLGDAFPELLGNPGHVQEIIRDEEESFLRTLDRGLALFDDAAGRAGSQARISADDAFRLHDTYGFPIDLTRVMAEERGLAIDLDGYEAMMEQARQRSRRTDETEQPLALTPDAIARLRQLEVPSTDDHHKYDLGPVTARVEAIWSGSGFETQARVDRRVGVILDRTNLYAEAGGQVGDHGVITRAGSAFSVEQTLACGDYVLHIGHQATGALEVGHEVTIEIDPARRNPTRANHTGTHLLNLALRDVIGDDVQQKGSLVAPDRLRFDFSCSHAMSDEQVREVQDAVNRAIDARMAVHAEDVPLELARSIHGVRAVFGEHYPDPVRVVCIGAPLEAVLRDRENTRWREHSIEFCGGTHLENTTEARRLVIVHEQALAAGVRRISALTGPAALAAESSGRDLMERVEAAAGLDGEALSERFAELSRLADEVTLAAVDRRALIQRLDGLRERVKAVRKSARSGARERIVEQARQIAEDAGGTIIVASVQTADRDLLLAAMDAVRARQPHAAIMLFGPDEQAQRVTIVASVHEALVQRGLKAGQWVGQAARICGGGGGGRPDKAQAGGKDPAQVPAAMEAAVLQAEQVLESAGNDAAS